MGLYSAGTAPPALQDRSWSFSRDIAIPIKNYFSRNYTVVLQSGRHTCGYSYKNCPPSTITSSGGRGSVEMMASFFHKIGQNRQI